MRIIRYGMLALLASLLLILPFHSLRAASIEQTLRERLARQPGDATSWRLWGRYQQRHGDTIAALDAFRNAVLRDPTNIASQHDLGKLLYQLGDVDAAHIHLREVMRLDEDSAYAQESRELLASPPSGEGAVQAAGFGVPWVPSSSPDEIFDERLFSEEAYSDTIETTDGISPLSIDIETGFVFNSNVELAPISRELPSSQKGGFQTFFTPRFEYVYRDDVDWQLGSVLEGAFTFNESHLDDFNVQHYQPGIFSQWLHEGANGIWSTRLQYDIAYDEFGGDKLGLRNSLTASIAQLRDDGRILMAHWTIDRANFADDGSVPTTSSMDGWTNTLGVTGMRDLSFARPTTMYAGAEVQWADLEGSTFRYHGVLLHFGTKTILRPTLTLLSQFAWGYRAYPDYAGSPSRDETIWHAGVKLRKTISDRWTIDGTFEFDAFDSENADFNADRTMTGVAMTYLY